MVSQPMMFHRNNGVNHVIVEYHVDDSLGETDSKEMFLKCITDLKREGLESTVNWKPQRHLGVNIEYGANGQVTLHRESNTLQHIAPPGLCNAKPYFTPMEPMSLVQEESRSEEDCKLDPRVKRGNFLFLNSKRSEMTGKLIFQRVILPRKLDVLLCTNYIVSPNSDNGFDLFSPDLPYKSVVTIVFYSLLKKVHFFPVYKNW